MQFPRYCLYDRYGNIVTGVPVNLKKANFEYAKIALSQSLAQNPVVDESGQLVVAKRERLGPLEEEFKYPQGGTVVLTKRSYPTADRFMYDFVAGGGQGSAYR